MTDQAMVERVAVALYAADLEDSIRTRKVGPSGEQIRSSHPWDKVHHTLQGYWREMAEAAIKAMEPPHRHDWGYHAWREDGVEHLNRGCSGCGARQRYSGPLPNIAKWSHNSDPEHWEDR